MKFICKYICEEEKGGIAIEATSNKQVERYVYDFIFEQLSDKSDIQCSIVTFDCKNTEHKQILKEQDGIFWEV